MRVDVTMFALNSAKTRAIAIHYGDRGTKPVYSDDGVNWNACNALTAARSQHGGFVYIVLKNGDVYRTSVPQ